MADNRQLGRGRRRLVAAASALLLMAGIGLITTALLSQHSAPQVPLVSAADAPRAMTNTPSTSAQHPSRSPRKSQHASTHPAQTTPKKPTPKKATRKPSPGPGQTGRTSSDATGPRSPGLPASKPVQLSIPAIKVHSDLLHLGLDGDGALEVPAKDHYDQAAWYTGSPTPGELGPSVIEGHLDDVGSTPSVFFDLAKLRTGDRITVTRADHRKARFEVYRVQRYAVDDFPTKAVYGDTPDSQLRLITCGGALNSDGHHQDNTVVYARAL